MLQLASPQSEARNERFWDGQETVRTTWPGFCTSEFRVPGCVQCYGMATVWGAPFLTAFTVDPNGLWGYFRSNSCPYPREQLRWRHQYLKVIAQLQQPNATDIENCWFMSHKGSMESKHLGQVCFFNFFSFTFFLHSVTRNDTEPAWRVELNVCGKIVNFKADSGVDVMAISEKKFHSPHSWANCGYSK